MSPELSPEERRKSLLAAISSLPPSSNAGRRMFKTPIPEDAAILVGRAARGRRMTVESYLRRAAYAMAAHDLDIPVTDILEIDPSVTRRESVVVQDADGSRFGSWEIEGLVEDESSTEG